MALFLQKCFILYAHFDKYKYADIAITLNDEIYTAYMEVKLKYFNLSISPNGTTSIRIRYVFALKH